MTLSGEREHATAVYLACRHLPMESLGSEAERRGMLTEAAAMFDSIGHKAGRDQCYKLIRHRP